MSKAVEEAMRHFNDRLRIRRLEEAMTEIRGHLGACLIQRAPSDDAIIFEHIQAAYDLSKQTTT